MIPGIVLWRTGTHHLRTGTRKQLPKATASVPTTTTIVLLPVLPVLLVEWYLGRRGAYTCDGTAPTAVHLLKW